MDNQGGFLGENDLEAKIRRRQLGRPGERAEKMLQAEEALCAEIIKALGSEHVSEIELRLLKLGPAGEKGRD